MLKKRILIIICIAVAATIAIILYNIFAHFSDYDIREVVRTENAGRTAYRKQFSGLLACNPDGAALLDSSGLPLWNISFEMHDPQVDLEEDYAIIYDLRGSMLELVDRYGEVCRINTAYPITAASVANNGNVAVIMQQTNVAHVNLYDTSGIVIVEGQLHGSESGYPLSMSLSSSGTQMVVSVLHLSESDLKNDILFYDFSETGRLKADNKTAVYSYSDEVIPIVDHVSGGKVLAIGGNEAILFSPESEPKVSYELFFDTEVKSVLHNNDFFGIITEQEQNENEIGNVLDLYTTSGTHRFTRTVLPSYNVCKILDNDEIFITDGKNTSIYTSLGVEKFSHEFNADVSDMIPDGYGRNYYLLRGGELLKVRLK